MVYAESMHSVDVLAHLAAPSPLSLSLTPHNAGKDLECSMPWPPDDLVYASWSPSY